MNLSKAPNLFQNFPSVFAKAMRVEFDGCKFAEAGAHHARMIGGGWKQRTLGGNNGLRAKLAPSCSLA
jgi:hypothetical protein